MRKYLSSVQNYGGLSMPESKFGYEPQLPENIRELFMWLANDLVYLNAKWSLFKDLYASKESTALLSMAAPSAFNLIHLSLMSDIVMTLCRLSDPPQSMGEANLSIPALVEKSNCQLITKREYSEFVEACKPIRFYRNKRIGHHDLLTRIKPQENPIPGLKLNDIENIIILAGKILNLICQEYIDKSFVFSPVVTGDGKRLISFLKRAKKSFDSEKVNQNN